MSQLVRVALDLLREALRRRWFLALFTAISLVLVTLALTLEVEVIDGAIAGSKLFGAVFSKDLVLADSVLGAVSYATVLVGFYGGAVFMAVACSDFAPELLAPGRIEHLLSLPISRWQLLFGTYLGVVLLAAAGLFYGTLGVTALLGIKTGVWSLALLGGAVIGWCGFCALYAAMLTAAFFVRSAAVSAAVGVVTLVLGILSSQRETVARFLSDGVGRSIFKVAILPFPRLATLAGASAEFAAGRAMNVELMARLVAGTFIFAAALLAVAAWRFERSDY